MCLLALSDMSSFSHDMILSFLTSALVSHRLEYLTWRHLLQKHLHAKVGSKELSQSYFSNLMELLERLHAINERVNKMYTFKVIESFKL